MTDLAVGASTRAGWWVALRPRTLPVAVAPVLVGTAVALAEGRARALPALAALVGALLLQITSNIANDLFDFERGADNDDRIGPPRAAQQGLLTPEQLRAGIAAAVAMSVVVGSYLVFRGGWPIAVVGLLSIAAAIAYTGGPWPFGYKGLGDPAVFFFFGIAAVCGTHYVQALEPSWLAFVVSLPVGSLATAILVVNNTRDLETDAAAGKRTLAVRFGRRASVAEYGLLLFLPYLAPPLLWWATEVSAAVLLPVATIVFAAKLFRTVAAKRDGPSLNLALAGTARLALLYAALLALGLAWP